MVISFYGEGCFKISARGGSAFGGQSEGVVILTDPFENETGLTPPRFKSDVILKTFASLPILTQPTKEGVARQIYGPGEYDIKDASVVGFKLKKESSDKFLKTVYIVKIEGIKLCFLGHISGAPEPETAERLEEIDVLFAPAGGKPFLEPETAIKLIKQIEPKIIIPSFFKVPGLKRKAGDLKPFLEEFDSAKKEPEEKLTVKKKDVAEIKKTELVVLKI